VNKSRTKEVYLRIYNRAELSDHSKNLKNLACKKFFTCYYRIIIVYRIYVHYIVLHIEASYLYNKIRMNIMDNKIKNTNNISDSKTQKIATLEKPLVKKVKLKTAFSVLAAVAVSL